MLKAVALSVLLGGLFDGAASQGQTLTIHLGSESPGASTTEPVQPGKYTIEVKDLMSGKAYAIAAVWQAVAVDLPAWGESKRALPAVPACEADPYLAQLDTAKTEKDVQIAIAKAVGTISAETPAECQAKVELAELKTEVSLAQAQTIPAGTQLTVTVTRTDPKNPKEASVTYSHTFTTGSPGKWLVTYGFVFPFKLGAGHGHAFAESREYYVTPGTNGNFTVGATEDVGTAPVPSVLFSFLPTTDAGSSHKGAVFGGFGSDLKNTLVAFGWGETEWQFLRWGFGLAGWQERELLPQYHVGQVVSTNLTSDQLTESVFRVRPFLSLSFQLKSDIFGTSGNQTPPAPQQSQAPQPPPASH